MKNAVFSFMAIGAVGVAAEVKTPETSKLFERRVDSVSGVVSYALVYGAPDDNRQSLYFITKSMTEDGRFLLFHYTAGNELKPKRSPRILMVADLQEETVKPVALWDDDGKGFSRCGLGRRRIAIGCNNGTPQARRAEDSAPYQLREPFISSARFADAPGWMKALPNINLAK